MKKKYKLTRETTTLSNGKVLHRIVALRSFNGIHAGDLGGFVESEDNLSHIGNCWIFNDAMAYDNSRVGQDARLYGKAKIYESAMITGYATLYDYARAFGNSIVRGRSRLSSAAKIYGNAYISGDFSACSDVNICGDVELFDSMVLKTGIISDRKQILTIGPIGSRDDKTIFILQIKPRRIIYVQCGCFIGPINKFEKAVMCTHENHPVFRETYIQAVEFARKYFNTTFPISDEGERSKAKKNTSPITKEVP